MILNQEELIQQIQETLNPVSTFLYGSRARDDFYSESDYEIGVLMKKDNYTSRGDIKKKFDIDDVNIFPFHYEEFIEGNIDTPFQKNLYIRDLAEGAKTVAGEKVVENLKKPEIKLLDLIQEVRFNLGYALAATHSYRNGDNATASLHFVKSCLFGTRNFIILKSKKFPISFDEIIEEANKLPLGEYEALPKYAGKLRRREVDLDPNLLFTNISYLNQFIEKELFKKFDGQGNIIILN